MARRSPWAEFQPPDLPPSPIPADKVLIGFLPWEARVAATVGLCQQIHPHGPIPPDSDLICGWCCQTGVAMERRAGRHHGPSRPIDDAEPGVTADQIRAAARDQRLGRAPQARPNRVA
jgi:hypothetical protein